MRFESSVTSASWIPQEAVVGLPKLAFKAGVTHYDRPLPDSIYPDCDIKLDELCANDRFRFANDLRAWAEVKNGNIVKAGYSGNGMIGSTRVGLGPAKWYIPNVLLPDIQATPEYGPGWVRFTQTAGGRTGVPAPRTVRHPPFIQFRAPIVWTTLSLTIHADGRTEHAVTGASAFPRHWIYNERGELVEKSGLASFRHWYKHAFGKWTPWGSLDSEPLVTAVESALERQISEGIMYGGRTPSIKRVKRGHVLIEQGSPGDEMYLMIDGAVTVQVNGKTIAELGPGSVLGERAILEGGKRTATVKTRTKARVAVISADSIDRDKLVTLSQGHRREENLKI